MKTKIAIIVLLIISFSLRVFSQLIDEKDVPDSVKMSLNEKFKVLGTPDWEKQNDDYGAEFYVGNYKGLATFMKDGSFVKSELEIDPTTVPDPVKNFINDHFKGLKIDYVRIYEFSDKKDNYYYVTAPKTIKGKKYIPEFSITPKGKLISENVPPELESYRTEVAPEPAPKITKKEVATPKKQEGTAKKETAVKTSPAEKSTGKVVKKNVKEEADEETTKTSETNSVPKTVKDLFVKKYKQVTEVEWKTTDNNFIASYLFKGVKNYAYYSKDGKFEKNQTTVDKKNPPPPLLKTLVSKYNDQKIVLIFNTILADNQKFYEVQLSPKKSKQEVITTVFTTPSGQVVKEILPEGMEQETENQITGTSVPLQIKTAFNLKYAKSTEIKWARSDSDYVATFYFKGDKMSATYSSDGKWQQSVKSVSAIKLPPPVQNFINIKYRKEKMESSQYIETNSKEKYYYIVTSSESGKGKDKTKKLNNMKISPAGKLIEQNYE